MSNELITELKSQDSFLSLYGSPLVLTLSICGVGIGYYIFKRKKH